MKEVAVAAQRCSGPLGQFSYWGPFLPKFLGKIYMDYYKQLARLNEIKKLLPNLPASPTLNLSFYTGASYDDNARIY